MISSLNAINTLVSDEGIGQVDVIQSSSLWCETNRAIYVAFNDGFADNIHSGVCRNLCHSGFGLLFQNRIQKQSRQSRFAYGTGMLRSRLLALEGHCLLGVGRLRLDAC